LQPETAGSAPAFRRDLMRNATMRSAMKDPIEWLDEIYHSIRRDRAMEPPTIKGQDGNAVANPKFDPFDVTTMTREQFHATVPMGAYYRGNDGHFYKRTKPPPGQGGSPQGGGPQGGGQGNSQPVSRKTLDDLINIEIAAVYDDAEKAGEKPPNIKELADIVLLRLKAKGLRTTKLRIMELGDDKKYASRRWPIGKRMPRSKTSR
jgi:hypothetical protein